MRNTDKWHPAEFTQQPRTPINWRAVVLTAIAVGCIVQAIVCGAANEPVNAANWFGFGVLSLAILTLRACLIDIKRGAV